MGVDMKYTVRHYINDIEKLCDDIYYLRRNIKDYIKAIQSSSTNVSIIPPLGVMIEKIQDFNEDVFLYTQYIGCNDNMIDTKNLYVKIDIIELYIREVIIQLESVVAKNENKYLRYIIMDLNKLFNPLKDLNFIVGDHLKFLNENN